MNRRHVVPCALAALTLTACGTGSGGGSRALPVTNINWEARSVTVGGHAYAAPRGVGIEITGSGSTREGGGRIRGGGGCNSFEGTAAVDKESLRVHGYMVTMEACLDGDGESFQKKFLRTLSGTNRLALSADHRTLKLTDGADAITFTKGAPAPALPG